MQGDRFQRKQAAGVLVGLIAGGSPGSAPEALVRVFARAAQAHPRMCGVLVGEAARLAESRLLARRMPCGDRLVFADAPKDPSALCRRLDGLVLPLGGGAAGAGPVLAEALRQEVPVIGLYQGAWAAGGARGVLLVPEGDEEALERALASLADRVAPREATDLTHAAGSRGDWMPPGEGWPR